MCWKELYIRLIDRWRYDEWIHESIDEWIYEWIYESIDESMDEWIVEWIDEYINEQLFFQFDHFLNIIFDEFLLLCQWFIIPSLIEGKKVVP